MNSNEYQKDLSRDSAKNDNNRDSINSKDFMIGALIGGIVGAATALFLAPKSGKELRYDLNDSAKMLSQKTEKIRKAAMEKGAELTEVAKAKTSTLGETVAKQTETLKENVKKLQRKEVPQTVSANTASSEAASSTTDYIAINESHVKQKLEEAENALTETENKLKQ
ncbi:YtxH domain-containing protein [Bacillus massiliigorillae]|uniref:YtxH domain-containing protein n=1 Tax=Bacillus massiliigorillae TaxID=1243664 RepID=UPI0003A2A6EC|nr:YtxH domain-containing protein [Bacillus massiliigorillae]